MLKNKTSTPASRTAGKMCSKSKIQEWPQTLLILKTLALVSYYWNEHNLVHHKLCSNSKGAHIMVPRTGCH